jgi:tetratricopeptide (TPR) repeat protein
MLVSGLMTLACVLACASALRPWVAQWAGRGTPLDRAARTAISINPGNDRFQVILANLYQYSLFLRDYPAALTYYQSALRANPLDSTSWLHLAKLYQKLDRHREADRALRLAVQLAPSNSTIMWETTLAYLELGQLPEALRTLTRFISMSRDDTDRAKGYALARRLATKTD